ncbi:hypothetical protein GUITHDRAFT_109462 [Guillardia theta CCMP2712]|uniref:Uncharacterized protein n=1 Tax=Guillardia theta (strain CCMP2712) TaxID=905079 RepID=L1J821_GUITC|nr:hypothetical protein GUITHDRAFT_109462 [Guillardia theta CCMP2712]EKX44683.1 hypothetical protein GUITHDRAFT_109462 [Guillardia theta CCMP2712]|eukprot:XP_005831663.1 hypothetical protein GUITHDRAFT_109462 [Guillardia theta CCMP2712]
MYDDSDIIFLKSDEVLVDGSEPSDPNTTYRVDMFDEQDDGVEQETDDDDDVGVLKTLEDDAAACIARAGPVYSLSTSPYDSSKFACGGGDDSLSLWQYKERGGLKEMKVENSTFTDSVIDVRFSHEGTFIAAAAMDGVIKVWMADTGELVTSLEGSGTMNWMEWHPRGSVILAGSDDGNCFMWEISSSSREGGKRNFFSAHPGSVTCGGFAAGINDPVNAHADVVTALACHPSDPVCVSGDKNGRVILFHSQTGKIINKFPLFATSGHTASTNGRERACCYQTRRTNEHGVPQHEGATKLLMHVSSPMLFSAGAKGNLYVWSILDGSLIKVFRGHHKAILSIAITRDAKFVLTGSDDSTCRAFKLPSPS